MRCDPGEMSEAGNDHPETIQSVFKSSPEGTLSGGTGESRQQSADERDQTCLLPPEEVSRLSDDASLRTMAIAAENDDDFELKTIAIQDGRPVQKSLAPTLVATGGNGPPASGQAGQPKVHLPGYEILGELGRGGMGVVYRARHLALNRLVAVKMIIAGGHASADQLNRFRIEAESVARLQHPNIVQVYDIGENDGLPFFSLEFVDGPSLDKVLLRKPQPEGKAAEIVETLARAMHYAHQQGVIHRDLKPANVLMMKSGEAKISDFGLAKQLESDSSQTRTGTIMGTPSYMAPEQGRGEKQVGGLADVYAMGSMLYEMICGRPPFLAASAFDTLKLLLNEEPIPPSRLQPRVSRDLETICLKCLQKDPQRRYESAEALADDLQRFREGKPIVARPIGRVERIWRWCVNNPQVAALSGLVALLTAATVAASALYSLRLARESVAVVETRKQARDHLSRAEQASQAGRIQSAQDLVSWSDPLLLTSPELQDERRALETLRTQLATFREFHRLLDEARYLGLFGTPANQARARATCHELIALYDQIEQKSGLHSDGWPPLAERQAELLREDLFEAFLVASQVERTAALAGGATEDVETATRQAVAWLDRAEQLLPPTKALHVRRGGYYERLGDAEKSRADLERAAGIEPRSAVDRFWHGFAEYRRGEEARLKGESKPAIAFYRNAAAEFARVVEARPENFWAYFTWATCHATLGNRHDAIVGFTTCISLRSDAPWPYANRGTVHLQLGEADRALEDFSRSIEYGPEDPSNFLKRASAYFSLQDFPRAKADYSTVLQLDPQNLEARRSRAVVSIMGRELDDALADWQWLAREQPSLHEPHYFQGVLHLGRREYADAAVHLEEALRLKPGDPNTQIAQAMLLRWQGQPEAALDIINAVLARKPSNPQEYLIEQADLLRALGRLDESLEKYQQCVTLAPGQIDAYVGLAQVLVQQGQLDKAREVYDLAIQASPKMMAAHLRFAEFLRAQSDWTAARTECTRAAEIDPQSSLPGLVLAGITAAEGDPAAAVAQVDQLLAGSQSASGQAQVAAAQAYSLAAAAAGRQSTETMVSLAQQAADKGVAALRQSVGPCFHDLQYPEHNRLAWDPALDELRKLASVQELLHGRK